MVNLSKTQEARMHSGEKIVSSVSGAGKNGKLHVKQWDLEHSLISHTKINSNRWNTQV